MFFRIKTNKLQFSLQTPHAWKQVHSNTFLSGRASRCTLRKASLTLETALALPAFLFAVTALLYLFSFSSLQAGGYRKLTEKAELLAVTAGEFTGQNPYITLYDYETAKLPFAAAGFGSRGTVQKVTVRSWVGYTGESFQAGGKEELVYRTPEGEVYHKSRDCTYLRLTIRSVTSAELSGLRNESGGKYAACEYCVKKQQAGALVYITDYGSSYHNKSTCQGLKRTIMAVPLSQVEGLRSCSRCGGSY